MSCHLLFSFFWDDQNDEQHGMVCHFYMATSQQLLHPHLKGQSAYAKPVPHPWQRQMPVATPLDYVNPLAVLFDRKEFLKYNKFCELISSQQYW